jgi:predicted PurR-regulated permease PerM
VPGVRGWIQFGGWVLAIGVLNWAEPVFLPIAVALLLTFLLNPPVTVLQRVTGRAAAALIVVTITVAGLTLLGWVLARQVTSLASELPGYRQNIREKVADIRNASREGAVGRVQSTIEEIKEEIAGREARRGSPPQAVVVAADPLEGVVPSWLSGLLAPLATVGFVIVLVVFMLLEERAMGDRLIGLVGERHVAIATKAFDEAATRLSRYLLMQTLINAIYGIGVGVGLWLFGVPYPLLWAVLAAVLRFIPYIGPWIAAVAPILVSLAAIPGWTKPLWVVGLFVALELFTNFVLETILYAGAAGVSQVALIIAIAFWTWLWGPIGLLLATPLTVCVVVLGRHVPGLRAFTAMVSDRPVLAPDAACYQRLLADQPANAQEIIGHATEAEPAECAFDALLIPSLNYAEHDRALGHIGAEDEQRVVEAVRELVLDVDAQLPKAAPVAEPARILGYPVDSVSDEAALDMLASVMGDLPVEFEMGAAKQLVSEMIATAKKGNFDMICLVDLPPHSQSRVLYVVKRLRQAMPDVRILVGRWATPVLADRDHAALTAAGASHVASTLLETRNYVRELVAHLGGGSAAENPEKVAS